MNKKAFSLITLLFCINTYSFSQTITPRDESVCGGTTVTYRFTPSGFQGNFEKYQWDLQGGTFSDGSTVQVVEDENDTIVTVNWSNIPQSGQGLLKVTEYYESNTRFDDIEPWIEAIAQPGVIEEADGNGDIIITAGILKTDITSSDTKGWHVDSYFIVFESENGVGGLKRIDGGNQPVWEDMPLDALEYGLVYVYSVNDFCQDLSPSREANIVRKLSKPSWVNSNSHDDVMCLNTTSWFSINPVAYADSYTYVVTGGYQIWDGSQYVSSYNTSDTSVKIKARSSNGAGKITITAHLTGATLDSDPLELDLWSGTFPNTYVTGTTAVCHNSLYVYTAVPPAGDPSDFSYSWTYPTGWYYYSQWNNNIQLQTPTLASNMTYGTVRASITNECSPPASPFGGITVYPGYSCGGYYMASPNPAGEYTDISLVSDDVQSLDQSYDSDITLTVVDKMGAPKQNVNVESLPYRLDTSKLPRGEYVIRIVSQAKGRETRVEAIKIIVNR